MRLNYFGYFIENHKENKEHLVDIRPFVKTFCKLDLDKYKKFKNSFLFNNEHVYLFPAYNDIYLFLMTRSSEIIKKINTESFNIEEIYDMLSKSELLGFASYAYISDKFIGFASTTFAPKITVFASFIDEIFKKTGLADYNFVAQAMLHQVSKEEALKIDFIGRTVIQIDNENGFFKDLANTLSGSHDDALDVESFELVIKPKNKKDITGFVKNTLRRIDDSGVDKFIIKAKDELQDHLTDLYLVGKGAISDNINTRDEVKIYESILLKTENNQLLQIKVDEFMKNERFTKEELKNFSLFNNIDPWSIALSGV